MRKTALILALLLPMLCIPFVSNAQMSDKQVVSYITEAALSGKTEAQIANELLSKGVSTTQISRLISQYRSQGATISADQVKDRKATESVVRQGDLDQNKDNPVAVQGANAPGRDSLLPIWGHDVFNNPSLTFEPNDNAATPEDYVLGPGDQVIIDIYGVNEANITQTITPEGKITVSQVGPIYLSGLTIKDATTKISKSLSKIYSSIGRGSKVSVTLGKIRSIQVNIIGEVKVPGTYRLSSLTTVFNAIYRAGGVTEIGSLRQINVVRGGEQIASVDLYAYLFSGSSDQNVSLKEGDVVIVPAYETIVTADGGVRRPMRYEMKAGEGIDALLRYAGGLTGDASASDVLVERHVGPQSEAHTVAAADFAKFQFKDLDVVTVSRNKAELFANEVEVQGAVYRPGKFELGGDVATVRQLVQKAGGLTETAFWRPCTGYPRKG
jgi:Periplasmic protein involved in polysaccharide export